MARVFGGLFDPDAPRHVEEGTVPTGRETRGLFDSRRRTAELEAALEPGTGQRRLLPPEHPDHPANTPPPDTTSGTDPPDHGEPAA